MYSWALYAGIVNIDKSHIRKERHIRVRDHSGEILSAAQMKGRGLAQFVGGAEKILLFRMLDHILSDLAAQRCACTDVSAVIDTS